MIILTQLFIIKAAFFVKYSVGRLVLTKLPGKLDRYGRRDAENVTHQYKNSEYSSEERHAVANAMRCLARLNFLWLEAIIVWTKIFRYVQLFW